MVIVEMAASASAYYAACESEASEDVEEETEEVTYGKTTLGKTTMMSRQAKTKLRK
ncbi:MAG: hypothetical protein U5K84_08855 [Alkalibacterium sp.]|nr:hypothetical protein [Alkalibacterium sp.]